MSPGASSSGADGPSSHNHIRPWITAWTASWIVPGSRRPHGGCATDRAKTPPEARAPSNALVLAGTGKTGSRLAAKLARLGLNTRTAARNGADVRFDWDDATTHRPALQGVDRLYLVAPVMRMDFAQVATFLDLAEAAGVRHVTYLSAYGIDQAPPQVALRSVELDLIARGAITHSILRPAWFMQNFSETFLKPVDGVITVPTADGSEAFIDAEDIAAVAETLAKRVDRGQRGGRCARPVRSDAADVDRDRRFRNGLPAQRLRREGHRGAADHVR